ncbi:putative methyltransferase [Neofusicoccum parvum]|uniref:Methyltransferase n=1 Tax=Neofusicoccum parvum TaxID=310453 RepID=A0ACB5RW21_9PEZI|nr:putative methyltransferase [Neofusicoccum parvum]
MTSTDQDDPPEPSPTADQLLPGDAANPTPAHDALSPAAALDHGADALRLLNRSPHPYHRRSVQLHHSHHHSETQSQQQQHPSPSASPTWSSSAASSDNDDSARGGAAAARKGPAPTSYPSQTASRSMSESGTEADDEGYSFVKALPAPPIRPHKGLRDLRGGDAALALSDSGLLTPNQLDEEGRRLSAAPGYFKGRGKGARRQEDGAGEVEVHEEVRKERERYAKRRRAEMLRRGCEVALLAAIGLVVLRGAVALKSLGAWSRELSAYVAVYALLILLYPLRLLFFPQTSRPKDGRPLFRNRIHIPAAFDPAPLLYPAAIPVFVSLSLYPSMEKLLLPNIVLAASALPPLLIPSYGRGAGYSMEHWFVSIIPLIISEHTDIPSKITAAKPYLLKAPADRVDSETIASLFALHQALLPPLYYLTTTSLLPAELHLLSISLINILLFSTSPQMNILSAILWVGGVSLFISCGHTLRWNVALARIPKWRFRRAGRIIKAQQTFLEILSQGIRGASRSRSRVSASDSDADEDGFPGHLSDDLRLKPVESAPETIQRTASLGTRLAIEAFRDAILPSKETSSQTARRGRRNTLPNPDIGKDTQHSTKTRAKRRKQSYAQSFLALTPTQATIRRWLYAGYTYVAMVLLILVPIRARIAKYALDGQEPFGWAIGYLLGNIRDVRFWVFDWGFDSWISLPPLPDFSPAELSQLSRAEYIRHVLAGGPANTRLFLIGYWMLILIAGMTTVLSLSATVEVDTRRKVFHGMMVAMLLPTAFVDPAFIALTLALVLSVFCLLDLIRAAQLPPLSKPLAYFLTPYVDGRDLRGPVVVSHIFLLIGCAIPLWLSLAGTPRGGEAPWRGWELAAPRDVSMVAGVVCVGMGDAAASLIGRRWGRRKWPWLGGKSLEGSVAFAAAVTVGLVSAKAWLRLGQWDGSGSGALAAGERSVWPGVGEWFGLVRPVDVGKAALAGAAASFMEAVLTGGNDNVVVPVVLCVQHFVAQALQVQTKYQHQY